jgi:hypothetical protein
MNHGWPSTDIAGGVAIREVLAESSVSAPAIGFSNSVGAVARFAQSPSIGRALPVGTPSDRCAVSLAPEIALSLGCAGGTRARAAGRPAPLSPMGSNLFRAAIPAAGRAGGATLQAMKTTSVVRLRLA